MPSSDPISPYHFVLAAEILTVVISNKRNIIGVMIFGKEENRAICR